MTQTPTTISHTNKHPLADLVRILARGKNASRSMTFDEARFTMGELIAGRFEPEQLGAILMLLRVKEETAEELAGFAAAINDQWPASTADSPAYDLVWPSYAGKRRQPFWCLLSALLLEQMGYRILFHGSTAHTEGRVYLHEVFEQLDLATLAHTDQINHGPSLAYLPCEAINPLFQRWLSLKAILGVRSPINTLLKTIAPHGTASVQGIFHPSYAVTHAGAAAINGNDMLVIKGEGGEFEVNPERSCRAYYHLNGQSGELVIPNQHSHFADKPAGIDSNLLVQMWQGGLNSEYAYQAVIHTAALALVAIRKQPEQLEAITAECQAAWQARDTGRLSK
ncbi:glycosyl transferase family protein [Oceanobacter sp. 3_MG-2023]|uniref:glycosyl transferase family protein n=1 Tax=Oceanobacter sp. 3_MG-2023 TaxID=3062622 RepID=UPI0027369ECA|nr:glycosyl transferase family protein [Oceanobacter sp. 3_MG-2023]MDP2504341.1 glycosyl transferase family protein [Oceanobacter sp. 3_MG-2023]